MLKDCLDIFKERYEEMGEKLITDNYSVAEGTYILVSKNFEITKVEVGRKSDKIDYEEFVTIDYLSKLIDMNKPIDRKKVIHSNNYLTFWVKKENLKLDKNNIRKLTDEIIDGYYEILSNPSIKYMKNKKSLALYDEIESKIGKVKIERIEIYKKWIKDNIFSIMESQDIKDDKNYLKIFFEADYEEYDRESTRYLIPNIYNSNDYNINFEGETYGLPNDNMGLNSKKIYLENKTRKNSIPYLISIDEVKLQRKFIDYLYNESCQGNYNIYIGTDSDDKNVIKALSDKDTLENNFYGYFLRIKKGKEVEIHDFDTVTNFNPNLKEFYLKQIIPIADNDKKGIKYGEFDKINEIKNIIDEGLFSKCLNTNYFKEAKDIKINDSILKEEILRCRNAFFTWFYKGNKTFIKSMFDKSSLNLIKNSICNEYKFKATEQFNIRSSIIQYFYGGNDMADRLKNIHDTLRLKINDNETSIIESDMEYYFAIGQLASYFISLNRSNKKKHSLVNPILNCKTNEKLKKEMFKFFVKYNYDIEQKSKRFNNLQSMVLSYSPEKEVMEDILIAGYLYSSLIYEKGEKVNE